MNNVYFVSVDVGTGSVRAALVNDKGNILKVAIKQIKIWNPQQSFYEQSSDNIWASCTYCIKNVLQGVSPNNVKGIGFDATCSLVAVDCDGYPVSVSPTGNDEQNVIVWMDHRASKEAETINKFHHHVLKYVGGKISLEMETPKLLWLKTNLKDCWSRTSHFFDLPDFLTWKATGCTSRSLCSLVCKWTYEIKFDGTLGWNGDFFKQIGLEDLVRDNYGKIGTKVQEPGSPVGHGLSKNAATELGLLPGTPVGASIIDAHAGGLGLLGCSANGIPGDFNSRLSLICGTSTCHMVVSNTPIFTQGVWGPYYSAMVPGMWLNEGGQSATGKLIDHIIDTHPATNDIKTKIGELHIQQYLNKVLLELARKQNLKSVAFLTKDLHVWPDFHGNRSPIADSTLKGMISGLTLNANEENLALLYLATIQAVSYGTRHILEKLKGSGYDHIKSILICGGLSKNSLFTESQADVVNLPVLCPNEVESVLLGSAILGACASGYFSDMRTAITSMGGKATVVHPDNKVQEFHNKKYKVFLEMYECQKKYRDIMNSL